MRVDMRQPNLGCPIEWATESRTGSRVSKVKRMRRWTPVAVLGEDTRKTALIFNIVSYLAGGRLGAAGHVAAWTLLYSDCLEGRARGGRPHH
jgi:hypothetical protein